MNIHFKFFCNWFISQMPCAETQWYQRSYFLNIDVKVKFKKQQNALMKNLISKKSYRASPIQLKLFKTRMNNALARKLQDYIEFNKLTKLSFAKIMRKDPAIISRWLSGDHNFTIETLCEISFKTRIPITELLDCHYLFKGYWTNPEFTALCERVH